MQSGGGCSGWGLSCPSLTDLSGGIFSSQYKVLQRLSGLPVYHTCYLLGVYSWCSLKNGWNLAHNEWNLSRSLENAQGHFSLMEKLSSCPRKRLMRGKMMTLSIINQNSICTGFVSLLGSWIIHILNFYSNLILEITANWKQLKCRNTSAGVHFTSISELWSLIAQYLSPLTIRWPVSSH